MATTVLARSNVLSYSTSCRPGRSAPGPSPRALPFFRGPRPMHACGGYSQWDPAAAEGARRMWREVAPACKKGGRYSRTSGGFFWPGGGFVMGPGAPAEWQEMVKKWHEQVQQEQPANQDGAPSLRVDVVEDDLTFTLYADVPGLSKPDLSIRLSKANVLTISGERKPVADEFVAQERAAGAFKREWALPDNADGSAISAKVTEGVLTITVGKRLPEPEVDDSPEIRWA